MYKNVVPGTAALAFVLTGCSDTVSSPSKPLSLSKEVVLNVQGKKTPTVAVTPVKFSFPDDRSYSAIPLPYQPKSCRLVSTHFSAEIAIPSQVNLPAYGKNTPPMQVLCQSDHYTFDETIKPVNLTQQAANTAAAAHFLIGYGLVGAIATSSAASQRDKSQDLFGYPLKIELK